MADMPSRIASGGTVLVLAPIGRDASACATLVTQAGLAPLVCNDVDELVAKLDGGAEVVLLTEEALYGKAVDSLVRWVSAQPPWSDQPFVVLTNKNQGPRFARFRRDLVVQLRNVAFLERPLQAISLQAALVTAERGRRRQYQARAYLEAQRDAADELERLVAARTEALELANRQLREESERRARTQEALLQAQKLETIGQLVGGVAHDFNNLLMAVTGNLDLLAKTLGPDPRTRRLLDGAIEGARRGATLTQRLLAFARKQELRARATDLAGLVDGMRSLIERSIGPMVELRVTAPERLPAVRVDPNQLEMALLNLAVNARDAMPEGGVLTIALDPQTIAGRCDDLPSGPYVRLTVRDTGTGMDSETLSRAVEPFFSTKGVGKGTGLGLSMVHGLAQQSGGAFRIESQLGVGTAAHLWLPVTAAPIEESAGASPAQDSSPAATILLVDDDVLIAASTQALLEDLGHRVIEAHSGSEALALLEQGLRPDLVITDYAMPGMTGIDLAAAVRTRAPELPILLATGYAEIQGRPPDGLPRMAKPYTQSQLSAQISRLLPQRI